MILRNLSATRVVASMLGAGVNGSAVITKLVGTGLTLNWMWVLVFLLPSLIACHYVLIVPEEKYLVAKFGKEYHMYATRVHRWIGRSQSPHEL